MSKVDLWEVYIDDDSGEEGAWGVSAECLDTAANGAACVLTENHHVEAGAIYPVTANLNAVWVDVAGMPWDAEMTGSEETLTGTVTISGGPGAWAWTFEWNEVSKGEEVTVG